MLGSGSGEAVAWARNVLGRMGVRTERPLSERPCEAVVASGPVLALSGWSGSGKTSLLESVLPTLREDGLHVAVVKHDAHGLAIDHPGKDSDRLYRAGGDVVLQGPDETLVRLHRSSVPLLAGVLDALTGSHDLVLVEGHKDTPMPKIWVEDPAGRPPPDDLVGLRAVLPTGPDQLGRLRALIEDTLAEGLAARPLRGAVLIGSSGDRSRRAPLREPDCLEHNAGVLAALTGDVVLVGDGDVPEALAGVHRLPDAPLADGSLRGMLAALRWDPSATWIIARRGSPPLDAGLLNWLLGQRRPGTWAILPRLGERGCEPFPAVYEPQSRALLEAFARSGPPAPTRLAEHPKVSTPRMEP